MRYLILAICFLPTILLGQTKIITKEAQISNLEIGDHYLVGEINFKDPEAMFKNDEVVLKLQPLIDKHFENLSEDTQKEFSEERSSFLEIERQIKKPNAISTIAKFKKSLLVQYAKYKGIEHTGNKTTLIKRLIEKVK